MPVSHEMRSNNERSCRASEFELCLVSRVGRKEKSIHKYCTHI